MKKKTLIIIFALLILLPSCSGSRNLLKTGEPVIVVSAYQGGHSLLEQIFSKNIDYAVDLNGNKVAIPAGFDKLRPNMVWSPNERWLAFDKLTQNGNNDIFITDWPAQSKLIRVTNALGDDLNPSWSPDSTRITYENYYDGYIYILDISCLLLDRVCGPQPSFVTKGSNPVWSPDGKYIAYEGHSDLCNTCDRAQIFVVIWKWAKALAK